MKYKPKPRIVDMIDAMQWDGTLSGATELRDADALNAEPTRIEIRG